MIRPAHTDTTKSPPMIYLVATGCPRKWTTGDGFGACVCGSTNKASLFPAIHTHCEHMRLDEVVTSDAGQTVNCYHPHLPPGKDGVQFGVPTVSHYPREADCGSHPD